MSNIDILMASYNSEKYIESQINSILNQTYNDYHIYINDDISTDNTLNILQNYKKQHNNIFSINQNSKRLGIKENFSALMDKSTADYIMFSDHDDVWFNNKIEITYNEMTALEKKYSASTPLLVFTYKAVMSAGWIAVKNNNLYYYRQRKSGAMNQGRKEKMFQDRMEYMAERFETVTDYFPELYREYLDNLTDNLIRFKTEAGEYADICNSATVLQKKYLRKILTGPLSLRMKYSFVISLLRKNGKENGQKPEKELPEYYE